MKKKRLLVLLLCFTALCTTALWLALYKDQIAVSKTLRQVSRCFEKGVGIAACASPLLSGLLEKKSGAEVMDMLSKRYDAVDCHYMGHLIGQELYRKEKDLEGSINACGRACNSACVHGAIGTAFADKLGYSLQDDTIDLAHLSGSEIQKVGKELCTTARTCHGVGHALFQAFGEIPQALSMCDQSAQGPRATSCYSGVFMEYADVISLRSARPAKAALPSAEDLRTFCSNQPSFNAKRACSSYLPRIAQIVYRLKNEDVIVYRTQEICSQMEGQDRLACFYGIGSHNNYLIEDENEKAVGYCEGLPRNSDQAACHLGTVSINPEDRVEASLAYCGIIADESSEALCYRYFFQLIEQSGNSALEAAALCKSSSLCAESARNIGADPWAQISSSAGE